MGKKTMTRISPFYLLFTASLLGLSALGCESGGVGDPCTPEDEYQQGFNGYGVTEVNIESKSFQCETRVCLVNHFEGRVSCPYGQSDADLMGEKPDSPRRCRIPGTSGTHCATADGKQTVPCADDHGAPGNGDQNIDQITVPVQSQKLSRNAGDTVYCSCRCKGNDANARYCECPSGYECTELVRELGLPGKSQLAGSYCIKSNTAYVPVEATASETCADARDATPPRTKSLDGKYDIATVCGAKYENP
jgi:hypothetical protein